MNKGEMLIGTSRLTGGSSGGSTILSSWSTAFSILCPLIKLDAGTKTGHRDEPVVCNAVGEFHNAAAFRKVDIISSGG